MWFIDLSTRSGSPVRFGPCFAVTPLAPQQIADLPLVFTLLLQSDPHTNAPEPPSKKHSVLVNIPPEKVIVLRALVFVLPRTMIVRRRNRWVVLMRASTGSTRLSGWDNSRRTSESLDLRCMLQALGQ